MSQVLRLLFFLGRCEATCLVHGAGGEGFRQTLHLMISYHITSLLNLVFYYQRASSIDHIRRDVSFAAVTSLCLHTLTLVVLCRASQGHAIPVSPYREYIHLTQSNPGSASTHFYRYILYFIFRHTDAMQCNVTFSALPPVPRSPAMHLRRRTSLWWTEWTLSHNFSKTSSIRTLQSEVEAEKRLIIIK